MFTTLKLKLYDEHFLCVQVYEGMHWLRIQSLSTQSSQANPQIPKETIFCLLGANMACLSFLITMLS